MQRERGLLENERLAPGLRTLCQRLGYSGLTPRMCGGLKESSRAPGHSPFHRQCWGFMKEVVSELSLKEIYQLVIHQKPIGAKLEVNPSFLHFTSTSATPCSFPCFPSKSSNPNSTQYYLISPKTCPCHTHITLGPVHQIFYLGRSSPKVHLRIKYVFVKNVMTHLILPAFWNSLSWSQLYRNYSTILPIPIPEAWLLGGWLDCKRALCASLKDIDFIPWLLWNQRKFF